jgi:hypothetical protein
VAVPEPYVRYYRFYCSELIERTNGANGVKVGGETLAEDEGHGRILGGVGDGVALAGLNTRRWVGVNGSGEGRGEEGSARNDNLEETHVDGSDWVVR